MLGAHDRGRAGVWVDAGLVRDFVLIEYVAGESRRSASRSVAQGLCFEGAQAVPSTTQPLQASRDSMTRTSGDEV